MVGAPDAAAAGDGRRAAQHRHLVEQRDAIAWPPAGPGRRAGPASGTGSASSRPRRAAAAPTTSCWKWAISGAASASRILVRQTTTGLPACRSRSQELRRHLVVVALVGGDVDDHVGEGGGFEQARDVAGRRPGGHVGAVPDDEVLEQVEGRRIGGDAADLVNVLVEAGRAGLREALERAEEAEVAGPGERRRWRWCRRWGGG